MKRKYPETQTIIHQFDPVYDSHSKVLILGTMPSPKSREQGFYYGHPRNRFWPVLAEILDEEKPETIENKKNMVLCHKIALWDVLSSCEIHGADDSTIRNPVPNDMERIFDDAKILAVFTTGTKAFSLYQKYCEKKTGRSAILLPSTSPANCSISVQTLTAAYREILHYLV